MGQSVKVGSVPPEALSKGGLNEGPPLAQRQVNPVDESKLDPGPKQGEAGEYKPAIYKRNVSYDKKPYTFIREDR
jgi:hypothetical protein